MKLKQGTFFIDQKKMGSWSTLPDIYKSENLAAKQVTEWLNKNESTYRIRDYLGGVVWSNESRS
ncbi:MAG: hypothetical protein ISN29_09650 [Gammaproteobacteria bacterium AqS3]|nr:hypothetical protein [Gammaproteobacteria bacterium AqS3]